MGVLWPWQQAFGLWVDSMISRLFLLLVLVVVVGRPLPRLGLAAAALALRHGVVVVVVVSPSFPPKVGVVVVPLGDLGGL